MKTDNPKATDFLAEFLRRAAQQAGDDIDLRNWCLNLLGGESAGTEMIDLASLDGWHDLPKDDGTENHPTP